MNKDLRNEKKKLKMELINLSNFISLSDDFLNKKGKYFINQESIEALKEMQKFLDIKRTEYKKTRDRFKNVKRKIQESCNHEIVVSDEFNKHCAICGKLIIDEKMLLEIKLSDNYYNGKLVKDIIYEIVEEGIEKEDLLSYVEEEIDELQYSVNIKVRRLNQ